MPGPQPLRLDDACVALTLCAAPRDAVVSAAFQTVVHMVQPPASLFAPAVLWRALLKGGQGFARGRGAMPEPVQARAGRPVAVLSL